MADQPEDLKSLEQRLGKIRADVTPDRPKTASLRQGFSTMNVATTIIASMAGGILVGTLMGLVLDRLFGTSPIFLIVMLLLGSAAGILTAVRMAKELASAQPEAADADIQATAPAWDDEDEDEWLHDDNSSADNRRNS